MAPHKRKRDVEKGLNRQKADRHVGGSLFLIFSNVRRLSVPFLTLTMSSGDCECDDNDVYLFPFWVHISVLFLSSGNAVQVSAFMVSARFHFTITIYWENQRRRNSKGITIKYIELLLRYVNKPMAIETTTA